MDTADMQQRLAEIIKSESLRTGDFVLASGKRSTYYLDCRRTTLHPEGAWLVGQMVCERIDRCEWDVDAVGGLTLGADPVATATSIASFLRKKPLSAFLVRKERKAHGTGQQIEGAPPKGSRVVLVEDVVTTGGSTIIAAEAAKQAGLEVVGAIVLVDREEGGRGALADHGISLEALFTAKELLAR